VLSLRWTDGVFSNDSNEVKQMESHTDQNTVTDSHHLALLGFALLPVIVGTAWYLLAADGPGWFGYALLVVTLGLAVVFGASMSKVRGFTVSVVVAAAVVVGGLLGQGNLSEDLEDGASYIMLFAAVATIFVLAFWLIGVGIGSVWRHVAGHRREARPS